MPTEDISHDLLIGADVIASYLGVNRRQIYHACERRYLPLFRFGGLICARRSTLATWIEEQERTAHTLAEARSSGEEEY